MAVQNSPPRRSRFGDIFDASRADALKSPLSAEPESPYPQHLPSTPEKAEHEALHPEFYQTRSVDRETTLERGGEHDDEITRSDINELIRESGSSATEKPVLVDFEEPAAELLSTGTRFAGRFYDISRRSQPWALPPACEVPYSLFNGELLKILDPESLMEDADGLHSTFASPPEDSFVPMAGQKASDPRIWQLGFDAKVFARSARLNPDAPPVWLEYKLRGDKQHFHATSQNIERRRQAREALKAILEPSNHMSPLAPEFDGLATAFFNGDAIPVDLGAIACENLPNTNTPTAPTKNHWVAYNIGDWTEVLKAKLLKDKVMHRFLLDVTMANELEKAFVSKATINGAKIHRHSDHHNILNSLKEKEDPEKDTEVTWVVLPTSGSPFEVSKSSPTNTGAGSLLHKELESAPAVVTNEKPKVSEALPKKKKKKSSKKKKLPKEKSAAQEGVETQSVENEHEGKQGGIEDGSLAEENDATSVNHDEIRNPMAVSISSAENDTASADLPSLETWTTYTIKPDHDRDSEWQTVGPKTAQRLKTSHDQVLHAPSTVEAPGSNTRPLPIAVRPNTRSKLVNTAKKVQQSKAETGKIRIYDPAEYPAMPPKASPLTTPRRITKIVHKSPPKFGSRKEVAAAESDGGLPLNQELSSNTETSFDKSTPNIQSMPASAKPRNLTFRAEQLETSVVEKPKADETKFSHSSRAEISTLDVDSRHLSIFNDGLSNRSSYTSIDDSTHDRPNGEFAPIDEELTRAPECLQPDVGRQEEEISAMQKDATITSDLSAQKLSEAVHFIDGETEKKGLNHATELTSPFHAMEFGEDGVLRSQEHYDSALSKSNPTNKGNHIEVTPFLETTDSQFRAPSDSGETVVHQLQGPPTIDSAGSAKCLEDPSEVGYCDESFSDSHANEFDNFELGMRTESPLAMQTISVPGSTNHMGPSNPYSQYSGHRDIATPSLYHFNGFPYAYHSPPGMPSNGNNGHFSTPLANSPHRLVDTFELSFHGPMPIHNPVHNLSDPTNSAVMYPPYPAQYHQRSQSGNGYGYLKYKCTLCHTQGVASPEAPCVLCPGCGPNSNIRYCSIACLLVDSFHHSQHCMYYSPLDRFMFHNLPSEFIYDEGLTVSGGRYRDSPEMFRQKAFFMYCHDGAFPQILMAWAKRLPRVLSLEGVDLQELHKQTGDYHVFRSGLTGGALDPRSMCNAQVIFTLNLPNGIMKSVLNRCLNALFLTRHVQICYFVFRMIRHFILDYDEFEKHPHEDVSGEVLAEFRDQFLREFNYDTSSHDYALKIFEFPREFAFHRPCLEELEAKNPILGHWNRRTLGI